MRSRKILFVKGLGELDKLQVAGNQLYRYVVQNCHMRLSGRLPMVTSTKNSLEKNVIVQATPSVTVVCQLGTNEIAPEHLPRVQWAYL